MCRCRFRVMFNIYVYSERSVLREHTIIMLGCHQMGTVPYPARPIVLRTVRMLVIIVSVRVVPVLLVLV